MKRRQTARLSGQSRCTQYGSRDPGFKDLVGPAKPGFLDEAALPGAFEAPIEHLAIRERLAAPHCGGFARLKSSKRFGTTAPARTGDPQIHNLPQDND
jgi:hypothetical protein